MLFKQLILAGVTWLSKLSIIITTALSLLSDSLVFSTNSTMILLTYQTSSQLTNAWVSG